MSVWIHLDPFKSTRLVTIISSLVVENKSRMDKSLVVSILLCSVHFEGVISQGFNFKIPVQLSLAGEGESASHISPGEVSAGSSTDNVLAPKVNLKIPALATLMNGGGSHDLGLNVNWDPFKRFTLPKDEDAHLSVEELITKYGYNFETHGVYTKDGYILICHRIIGKKNSTEKQTPSKGPVFLQHGIFGSSADWLLVSSERALPFILSDDNYDVWMANSRGNEYSRRHEYFRSTSSKYWKFSLDEMGYYDVPAVIDYILKRTGFSQLHFVGHSTGTTSFFIAMSTHPRYNKKVKTMFALAPTAHLCHSASPFTLAKFIPDDLILRPLDTIYNGEYRLGVGPVSSIIRKVCGLTRLGQICSNLLYFVTGYDGSYSNMTTLARVFGHTPQSTSVRVLVHLLQMMRSKYFEAFDYGESQNYDLYGHHNPPMIHLHRTTVPVYGWYSKKDQFVVPKDAVQTLRELENWMNRGTSLIPDRWGHTDFLYHDRVKELLFDKILETLQSGGALPRVQETMPTPMPITEDHRKEVKTFDNLAKGRMIPIRTFPLKEIENGVITTEKSVTIPSKGTTSSIINFEKDNNMETTSVDLTTSNKDKFPGKNVTVNENTTRKMVTKCRSDKTESHSTFTKNISTKKDIKVTKVTTPEISTISTRNKRKKIYDKENITISKSNN